MPTKQGTPQRYKKKEKIKKLAKYRGIFFSPINKNEKT
jgi:hypothetical protein